MLIQAKNLILSFVLSLNLILILFFYYVSNISHKPSLTNTDIVNDQNSFQQVKGLVPRPTYNPNENYLAYLPHSGFHNQRITLENALLLAKYLNRTLLVPPVFLGPATEWRLFDILQRRIMLQTKRGLDHCGMVPKGDPLPAECLNYYSWTAVEWDFFYDMEKIRKKQPWIRRSDHSWAWMEAHLGIDRTKDVYVIDDRAHYDYQIYDDLNSATPLNTARYLRRLDVKELADRKERVVHMGSLFATGRVLAELPENKAYQIFLRRTMILSTPILAKTSDAIVSKLGGLGTFVGLHLRVGDGMFVEPAPVNIENMFKSLVNITGITPIPNYQVLPTPAPAGQDENNHHDHDHNNNEEETLTTRPAPERLTFGECQARKAKDGKYMIIYIATDGVYPRRNILFRKLFDHFPCIFTLDDFSEHLVELKEMKNVDGVGLSKDLIPMVDAVVSAKGRYFFGTPKSTFSTYVSKQLHPVFVESVIDEVNA
ncbi:hypothetical protein BC939DRAFT_404664 [Gamsiella multidivaricata]|uniref:uncharacterized protein n=1 Tax=Gamsiella multidivaricata TaxID=101098 RepID=UPI00221F2093|nr:uncharacterized protein BC939DRAFT_404664 [Gamsiella multidivaricata]KAG0353954.1 hypothetical protein BGZ54_001933 [Gamsiella multidivaricata]KAI7815854.1 hypothetical protein BC939DRAFT_404664 [Gamsiella multidivaricata]